MVTLLAWKHMWSSCDFMADCSLTKWNCGTLLALIRVGSLVTFSVERFLNDCVICKSVRCWMTHWRTFEWFGFFNIVRREQLTESKRKDSIPRFVSYSKSNCSCCYIQQLYFEIPQPRACSSSLVVSWAGVLTFLSQTMQILNHFIRYLWWIVVCLYEQTTYWTNLNWFCITVQAGGLNL